MRKSQLRQQVDQYCKHNHTGSFRTKKHRHFVLHKMVRDLYHIGHVIFNCSWVFSFRFPVIYEHIDMFCF